MSRKKHLEEQLALEALGDDQAVERIYLAGLRTLASLRDSLDEAVHAALEKRNKRSYYVLCKLPGGVRLQFFLQHLAYTNEKFLQNPLVQRTTRRGGCAQSTSPEICARILAETTKNDVRRAVKIVDALERARRQLFALAEESTRWL